MFRILSIMVLGVLVVGVSPADAQLFRRWFPQSNSGRAFQRRQQPNYRYEQTQRNPACPPQSRLQTQQQQQSQQQRLARQSRARNFRSGANDNRNAQAASNQQQLKTRQNAPRTNSAEGQQPRQQQRYAVFYDPRTNQRILRPVPAANPQTAGTNSVQNLRRQPTVQGQAYAVPAATQNQFDLARQRAAGSTALPINELSLNPPQPTVAAPIENANPVVSTSFIESANAATTTPVTSEPKTDLATKPESSTPQEAFSILESGDSDQPGSLNLSQDGSDTENE